MAELPDITLKDLHLQIGQLPDGDVPAAWYVSMHPDVLKAYETYTQAVKKWNTDYAELLAKGSLPPDTKYVTAAKKGLIGLVAPKGMKTPPRWWRKDKTGWLVPRRRTRAEKASEVNRLFNECLEVPVATDYMVGIPDTVWTSFGAFPVAIRRPRKAVLAILGVNPAQADPPFEVSQHWSKMKISTWHLLRERQFAAQGAQSATQGKIK